MESQQFKNFKFKFEIVFAEQVNVFDSLIPAGLNRPCQNNF